MLINRIVELIKDPAITDIHLAVNEPMWTRRLGELRRVSQEPLEDAALRQFLQRADLCLLLHQAVEAQHLPGLQQPVQASHRDRDAVI